MTTHLHFSIGPVQDFVARSRRTRDLWGSSYLLSFLAGHAMHGAEQAQARVIQPQVEADAMLQCIRGQPGAEPPRMGSLPNHFVVELTEPERAHPVADACRQALEAAWQRVYEAVWTGFVAPVEGHGRDTAKIWNRQVAHFWELSWVAGPPEEARHLYSQRKHWRTHARPEEPGDKCMVMPELQELSGYVRAHDRVRQESFWERLRNRVGSLDLREEERLCAIALIKRLFPKVAPQALGWRTDTSHWPSTLYISAVPWIRKVAQAAPEEARTYAQAVREAAAEDALKEHRPPFSFPEAGDLPRLDGNYLQPTFVRSKKLAPLRQEALRPKLRELLDKLAKQKDEQGQPLGTPPVFYALLLADGDSLGKLLAELKGKAVSQALARFTEKVPALLREHDGIALYAGGDDVLAMLPVRTALQCAQALSQAYRDAFQDGPGADKATLSAAVVMAHVRAPLTRMLAHAHHLLDDVAKDGNGRGSLAVAVYKRAGLHSQWVSAWRGDQVPELLALAEELGMLDSTLSASLLHRLTGTLGLLSAWPEREPGKWGTLLPGLEPEPFLAAELLGALEHGPRGQEQDTPQRARRLAERLWRLLPRAHGPQAKPPTQPQVGLDVLLLAHFLSTGGHEEEHT